MLRPTFQAFETAKRALSVAQMGLDTVGHNISNAQTPGYTRQRVDQVSLSLSGASSKFATFGVNSAGLGATVSGVNQIRDPYLDNRYRTEAAVNGELGVQYDGLTDICNIFDEIMTNGLYSKMGDLFNALDIFAQQADSKSLGEVVRNTASQLTQILNKNASQLETARTEQKTQLDITVENDVNILLKKISDLNVKIKEDNSYGNPSNELNDERNLLIDKLSEYLDVKVVRTPVKISNDLTIERLSIELKNSGTPPVMLVDSGDYNQLRVDEDPQTGNVSISVLNGISGAVIPNGSDIKLYNGALKGFLDVLNGKGPTAGSGENDFRGIPYYQAALDEFAQKLAEVFNKLNNVSADESAKSGTPPLVLETFGKNLFVPLSTSLKGVGGNAVPEWLDSVTSGTVQFSGKDYTMDFTFPGGTPPANGDTVTAKVTVDGVTRDYTGTYQKNGKIDFRDDASDDIAFSVSTTDKDLPTAPAPATSSVIVDAQVTARNISIASAWTDDPLFMTSSKFNPVAGTKATVKLTGNSNPTWISSISMGDVKVPSGNYTFTRNTGTTPNTIDVWISGTKYSAECNASGGLPLNSRVEFKDSSGNVGLAVNTNDKDFDPSAKNVASITYESGAANDNILKFQEAMKSANGYTVMGFSGSFQEYLISYQSNMSLDKELTGNLLDASYIAISGFADRRDAVSAVSVDEEGINMMMYQNYYNAAARYMTALDEALDKIINGMGTVGR